MMRLREEQIRALLRVTRETRGVEIDCEAYLARMPAYAEARADRRRPLPAGFDEVIEHERLCANCREETAALLQMLGHERKG
jgi:hypothetical protein